MTIYTVVKGDYQEDFYRVSEAKKRMKELGEGAKGFKTKVYADGDWVPCGEIVLNGSNKSFIANSPRNMKGANY